MSRRRRAQSVTFILPQKAAKEGRRIEAKFRSPLVKPGFIRRWCHTRPNDQLTNTILRGGPAHTRAQQLDGEYMEKCVTDGESRRAGVPHSFRATQRLGVLPESESTETPHSTSHSPAVRAENHTTRLSRQTPLHRVTTWRSFLTRPAQRCCV